MQRPPRLFPDLDICHCGRESSRRGAAPCAPSPRTSNHPPAQRPGLQEGGEGMAPRAAIPGLLASPGRARRPLPRTGARAGTGPGMLPGVVPLAREPAVGVSRGATTGGPRTAPGSGRPELRTHLRSCRLLALIAGLGAAARGLGPGVAMPRGGARGEKREAGGAGRKAGGREVARGTCRSRRLARRGRCRSRGVRATKPRPAHCGPTSAPRARDAGTCSPSRLRRQSAIDRHGVGGARDCDGHPSDTRTHRDTLRDSNPQTHTHTYRVTHRGDT